MPFIQGAYPTRIEPRVTSGLQPGRRASDALPFRICDMGLSDRGLTVSLAEQFPYDPDVVPGFEQVRCGRARGNSPPLRELRT